MSRRFNTGQRVAAYLAAGGRCTRCGVELQRSFHVDHRHPYSRGGPTDITNGQALCPTCNQRKGTTLMNSYSWQNDAVESFLSSRDDFLAVATPGAGKTRFALTAARELLTDDRIRRVIVVVPRRSLRRQWTEAAHRHAGIDLDLYFENRTGALSPDYDGMVVTYQAVAQQPQLYRKHACDASTLVILDEVHHAGDERSWGDAIRQAFEPAKRRLLLSGTPFRSDNNPIPFVTYVDDTSRPDYRYGYKNALKDGVVRPVIFHALDGQAQWSEAGTLVEGAIGNEDDEQARRALNSALDPGGDWMPSVLRSADAELSRVRTVSSDAGGLVVAANQAYANQYAAMLAEISGEQPAVVISERADASDELRRYAASTTRWLVAVNMVSEGVDIPRLTVGVYASNTTTSMFFRQVVGRFVRTRGDAEEPPASVFVPSRPVLLRHANEIEQERDHALEEQIQQQERDSNSESLMLDVSVRSPVWSGEATHHDTILSGEHFSDAELTYAENLAQRTGMPGNLGAAQAAQLLRAAGVGAPATTVEVPTPESPAKADTIKGLRKTVNSLVARYARQSGAPYKTIHMTLNKYFNEKNINYATVETLKQRIEVVRSWLQ